MPTYDPPEGTPGIDDNGPNTPPDPDPAPGYCASCEDPIPARGMVVCHVCYRQGYCPICGIAHGGARMCPEVRKAWDEQDAIAKAERSALVAAWAQALREKYERSPIWQEAA